jgi:hypothetical protein
MTGLETHRRARSLEILILVALLLLVVLATAQPSGGRLADSRAALKHAFPPVANERMEDISDTESEPQLEVDTELLDQLTDTQLHLLAGFRRLTPSQRAGLLRLVGAKEQQVSAPEEDLLVAAFHRLTPLQQTALIDLVDRIVEGMAP